MHVHGAVGLAGRLGALHELLLHRSAGAIAGMVESKQTFRQVAVIQPLRSDDSGYHIFLASFGKKSVHIFGISGQKQIVQFLIKSHIMNAGDKFLHIRSFLGMLFLTVYKSEKSLEHTRCGS